MKIKYRIHLAKINKLATATIMILTLFSCVNKELKNDWTEDGLKGKVKTVIQITYKGKYNKFAEIEKGEILGANNYKIIYDETGNKIEENWYNSDGSLNFKLIYKYDENGNKIEAIYYTSSGHSDEKLTYKYDQQGNQIEINLYNSDGSLNIKRTYKYDKKGNQIEENEYNSDGSLNKKWTYKYDKKGNKIKENWYNSDGNLVSKCDYKYDKKGNKNEFIIYHLDGSISMTIKYDENGNKIGEINHTPKDIYPFATYQYEYDKQKNWTKKIEFEDGCILETITEREYQYYE